MNIDRWHILYTHTKMLVCNSALVFVCSLQTNTFNKIYLQIINNLMILQLRFYEVFVGEMSLYF